MAGIELMLGMALGYLAFTEDGRRIGNKMADAAMKGGKAVMQNYIKKSAPGETPPEQKGNAK